MKQAGKQSVEIHEHTPDWEVEFREIGASLRTVLSDVAVRIDHIGSTSIVHLAAKPIIDVQISVSSLEPMDSYLRPIRSLGYVWRRDNPERTKRYFREPPRTRRTHIHVRKAGCWHEQFALLFRDYVRNHADIRRRYESVKRDLAQRYRYDRRRYSDAKVPILWDIMQKADRWAAKTGWEPGRSDA